MRWQTHIRINKEVFRRLAIHLSAIQWDRLMEGTVAPDKWGDYPHHYGKSHAIEKHIVEARKSFLENNIPKTCYCLGVALHYVQDSYTSLSSRSRHHERWEQQIEDSFFVEDLTHLISVIFQDNEYLRNKYSGILGALGKEVQGKQDTLAIATLLGRSQLEIWGKPTVDLNLALRASLLVVKSVFGTKTCAELDSRLQQVFKDYQTLLIDSENAFSNEIVALVEKRDKSKQREPSLGIRSNLRKIGLSLSFRIQNVRVSYKMKKYQNRTHMKKIQKEYERTVNGCCIPHWNWYSFSIPCLDITKVKKELMSVEEVSECFGHFKDLLRQDLMREIRCYTVGDKGYIKRSKMKEAFAEK